jgi:hypothetical protein
MKKSKLNIENCAEMLCDAFWVKPKEILKLTHIYAKGDLRASENILAHALAKFGKEMEKVRLK